MTDEQPCIWRRRAEAMLSLVNAALSLSDATLLKSQHRRDFFVVDAAAVITLRKKADEYRKAAEQEVAQP